MAKDKFRRVWLGLYTFLGVAVAGTLLAASCEAASQRQIDQRTRLATCAKAYQDYRASGVSPQQPYRVYMRDCAKHTPVIVPNTATDSSAVVQRPRR